MQLHGDRCLLQFKAAEPAHSDIDDLTATPRHRDRLYECLDELSDNKEVNTFERFLRLNGISLD